MTSSRIARHERGGAFNHKERAVEQVLLVLATLGKVSPGQSVRALADCACTSSSHHITSQISAQSVCNMTISTSNRVTALEQLLSQKDAEIARLKKSIVLGETQWNGCLQMTGEQRSGVKDYFVHFSPKVEDESEEDEESSIGSDFDEEAADAAYAAKIEQEDQEKMTWMERRSIHAGHLLSVLHEMMECKAERLTCGDVCHVHSPNERLKPDTALTFEITRSNDATETVTCVGGDTIYHLVELVCEAYINPRWESFNDAGGVQEHLWYLSSGGGADEKREEKDKILRIAMALPSSLRKQAIGWSFDFDKMAATNEYVGPHGSMVRDPYHENDGNRVFVSPESSPRLLECFVLRNGSTLTLEYDSGTFTLTCIGDDVGEG